MSLAERLQSVFVTLAAVLGLSLGLLLPDAHLAEHVILPALLVMLAAIFLQMNLAQVGEARQAKGLVAASLVLNFVFTPVLAWALGAGLLGGEPDLRIGLLLLLVTPCTDWYLVFTALARGHTGIATALLPVNLVLQLALLPLYILFLGGETVGLDWRMLFEAVVLVLFFPAALAVILRRGLPRIMGRREMERRIIGPAGAVVVPLLCLAVAAMFATHAETVLANWDALLLLLAPLLVFSAVLPGVSAGVGKLLKLRADRRVTLIMTTTARNSPIALALAVAAFPDRPLIAVALVAGPLLELPVLAVLSQILRVRKSASAGS